jgi:hypothetical protein
MSRVFENRRASSATPVSGIFVGVSFVKPGKKGVINHAHKIKNCALYGGFFAMCKPCVLIFTSTYKKDLAY